MTVYEELIDLKYRQGVLTIKLMKRFPERRKYINEVALLGVPERTLRKVIREKKLVEKLMDIKKKFLSKRGASKRSELKKPWFIWW